MMHLIKRSPATASSELDKGAARRVEVALVWPSRRDAEGGSSQHQRPRREVVDGSELRLKKKETEPRRRCKTHEVARPVDGYPISRQTASWIRSGKREDEDEDDTTEDDLTQ